MACKNEGYSFTVCIITPYLSPCQAENTGDSVFLSFEKR